jgi:hypothetical protein
MKKNRNLMLLVVLIITVSGITHAHTALAMSDKIIKQRIEGEAADTFRLRETKVSYYMVRLACISKRCFTNKSHGRPKG